MDLPAAVPQHVQGDVQDDDQADIGDPAMLAAEGGR